MKEKKLLDVFEELIKNTSFEHGLNGVYDELGVLKDENERVEYLKYVIISLIKYYY